MNGVTNHGLILVGYNSINSTCQSSETATQSERPKLTVSYGPRPTVDTSGETAAVSFRHGDGGLYSDTRDTWIQEDSTSKNNGVASLLRVRGYDGGDRSTLLAFRDIIGPDAAHGQIPDGSSISNATLRLTETANMNGGTQVALMVRDWEAGNLDDSLVGAIDEFGATWSKARDYFTGQGTDAAWETAGAQGNTDRDNASIIDADASETALDSGLWEWDVTDAVQAWADGTSNYGLILFRVGDSINGQLHSANAAVVTNRPLLTVIYTPPPPQGTLLVIH